MTRHRQTAILLLLLPVVLASAKSSGRYESMTNNHVAERASSLTPNQRTVKAHSNVEPGVRFFISPEESTTLPPVVTSATWKDSSSAKNDQKKGVSADKELGRSRWTNEIVRQRSSFASHTQDDETEKASNETSTRKLVASEPVRTHRTAEDRASFDVRRSSSGTTVSEDVTESRKEMPRRGRDAGDDSRTEHHFGYNAVAEETSNVDATNENGEEVESLYSVDADYDVVDDDYEDDDGDVQYYDDDSKTVDEQEDEETGEKRDNDKRSVGREAIYHEYEVSADSSRGIDFDTTNAEVVNEVKIVDRPVRRRRRKGRLRPTKKTRSKTRKRRRKRPPVEPVGRLKKPIRSRRPTSAGARRRKTKARRRRKGQISSERRRRKNRRNKQTTSRGFDLNGENRNTNRFTQSYRRPEISESTKPRLQQLSVIDSLQQQYDSLQQQYDQQQQQNRYDGQYSVPRYVDVHDGHNRRIIPATSAIRGQTSQQAASNRGDHVNVNGRVPPVGGHDTDQQTSSRPRATLLQGHYFDPRQYHQLPHHQHHRYYQHQQQQEQEQQQYPQHHRQYYQSYYQQQSAPAYNRHEQQIHFIVPTSDFDLRRIPQLMSALGLDYYVSGEQPIAAGEAHLHPSSDSGAYREGDEGQPSAEQNLNDKQHELSLSGSGLASTSEMVKRSQHLRQERSTSGRGRAFKTTKEEDGVKATGRRSGRPAKMRDSSEAVADDDDDDSEEYVDNSDVEITTRSPRSQTTALGPR